MSGVRHLSIKEADDGMRLDRWLRNQFPGLKQGKLEKLLRTGQIRLDGGRAKSGDRVEAGQDVRVPPNIDENPAPEHRVKSVNPDIARELSATLKDNILHMDDEIIAINKPAGLAVQGGSGTNVHIDGVLDWLKMGAKDRPRLVHRLDRDTSGVMLLARTRSSATRLTKSFQSRDTQKIYWAVTVGVPSEKEGLIDAPLAKLPGHRGELVQINENMGKPAKTLFRIIDNAGKDTAWLELQPLTGRTHQLRVHCQAIGVPIVGDPKYGLRDAGILELGIDDQLHLHARSLRIKTGDGKSLDVSAPLPEHMLRTFKSLGFDANDENAVPEDSIIS